MRILILRPQPGADDTADRARALGLKPIVAPLFTIHALDWDPPDPADIEAIVLTSANAARQAGPQLAAFTALPCYAVGQATAAAARDAGFEDVKAGSRDGGAMIGEAAADGIIHALHLCGRDHIPPTHPGLALARRCVYASEAVASLPEEAHRALTEGTPALLHSARAAGLFATLVDGAALSRDTVSIAAISEAAAGAAGPGWRRKAAAERPDDEALLELAAKLCQTGLSGRTGTVG